MLDLSWEKPLGFTGREREGGALIPWWAGRFGRFSFPFIFFFFAKKGRLLLCMCTTLVTAGHCAPPPPAPTPAASRRFSPPCCLPRFESSLCTSASLFHFVGDLMCSCTLNRQDKSRHAGRPNPSGANYYCYRGAV